MKTILRSVLALLAAALAPAGLILVPYAAALLLNGVKEPAAWSRFNFWLSAVLGTSLLYVVVLGVPAFLLLRWRRATRWWSSIAVGFVLGSVPAAIALWPGGNAGPGNMSSHSDGEKIIYTMVDGVTTRAGWVRYAEITGMVGLLGALGGLAFWLVWWSMRSNKTMGPTR
jgi:hypothetical protein